MQPTVVFCSRSVALPLHQCYRYISVLNTNPITVIITFNYVTVTEMQRWCNVGAKQLLQKMKKLLLPACAFKWEFTVLIQICLIFHYLNKLYYVNTLDKELYVLNQHQHLFLWKVVKITGQTERDYWRAYPVRQTMG